MTIMPCMRSKEHVTKTDWNLLTNSCVKLYKFVAQYNMLPAAETKIIIIYILKIYLVTYNNNIKVDLSTASNICFL